MPWPAIAAIAGKVLAGGAAAGAAGGAAGAAGAAGTAAASGAAAGGAGAAGAAGSASGASGLMSKMGGMMGGGQGGGKGGGMMQGIMGKVGQGGKALMGMMSKNRNTGYTRNVTPANFNRVGATETEQQTVKKGGKIKRPAYQMGGAGGLDPAFFDYLSKVTGQGLAENAGQTMDYADTQGIQNAVQGAEQTGAAQELSTAEQNDGTQVLGSARAMGETATAEEVTGNNLSPDQQSIQDPEMVGNPEKDKLDQMQAENDANSTGDAMKDAGGKLKSGNVIGAALGVMDHFTSKKSAQREETRQFQMAQGMHDQQQKRGSVYNNPQSVYSAKDGAAIPSKMKQNNNLSDMMQYREGGMSPEGSNDMKEIPVTTVTIPMPDGSMYDPSMSASPNMEEVNMLEMMSGGSTKMSYKNGGPGDPPDSTRVQQLVRKTTHTPPISDKPFQLVRKVTHTPPPKELKVKTTKTSGSSMNKQPYQKGGGTGEYDPNKHTWYENLYESTIGQYSDYLQPGYWLGTEKPGATSGGTNKKAIGSGPKIKGEGNVAGSALSITKGLKTKTSSGSMRASEKRAMAKGANRN